MKRTVCMIETATNGQKRGLPGPLAGACLALGLALSAPAAAQTPAPEADPAAKAAARSLEREAARMQAEAERTASYLETLKAAEKDQQAALLAMQAAREELTVRAEAEQAALQAAGEQEAATVRRAQQNDEELKSVQKELERAHENLRRASQEVARVHRQLFNERTPAQTVEIITGNRAVIGVVPGENTDQGVRILGISPGGPAEQAGLQPGDVISEIMGEPLADGATDSRLLLTRIMADVEPGDELTITVVRDEERLEKNLVAEERSPFSWQSVTRLSSAPLAPRAPRAPGAPGVPDAPNAPSAPGQSGGPPAFPQTDGTIVIQSIEGPELDLRELEAEIEAMHEAFGEQNILIERIGGDAMNDALRFEIDQLSEAGTNALSGANIWFGTRLTRGLRLASLDEELGRYFATSDGVLVLSAPEANALQLRGGDVILRIDRSEVGEPAEVMRALRNADAGELLLIDIMRDQQEQTMEVEIPENRLGLLFPGR